MGSWLVVQIHHIKPPIIYYLDVERTGRIFSDEILGNYKLYLTLARTWPSQQSSSTDRHPGDTLSFTMPQYYYYVRLSHKKHSALNKIPFSMLISNCFFFSFSPSSSSCFRTSHFGPLWTNNRKITFIGEKIYFMKLSGMPHVCAPSIYFKFCTEK